MKIIFDFDDVLFSTKDFKDVLFSGLEKFGVSSELLANYYFEHREHFINPRNFYYNFIHDNELDISSKELDDVLNSLFSGLKRFLNQELIDIVKKFGPENCFIISAGDSDFQMEKIKSCEIDELFGEIHIIGKDKNEVIEGLMSKFKGDEFIFIDDNKENIENARLVSSKNARLNNVHYPSDLELFKKLIK